MNKDQPVDRTLRAVEWGFGVLAAVVLLGLHLVFLSHGGPLWRDEINTVQIATLPTLGDVWSALRYDSFPLAPSLALRLWSAAGGGAGDWGFRLWGMLVGTALLGTLWLNARWLTGTVPVVSLVLFGASALVIRYGDSLRPYGLGAVFITLTLGLVWRVVQAPSAGRVAAAALAAVLSVQCLYNNAVLVLAVCLGGMAVAWSRGRKRQAALVFGIGVVAALSLVPYASRLRAAQDWVLVVQTPLTASRLVTVFDLALNAFGVQGLAGNIVEVVWLLLLALAVPAALSGRRSTRAGWSAAQKDLALYAATVLVVATLGYLGFILYASLPSQPWYFLSWMALAAVLVDALVVLVGPAWRFRLASLLVAAALLCCLSFPAVSDLCERQTNIDLLAASLERDAAKEDLIVLPGWFFGVSFQRYYHGPTPWLTVPPLGDLTIHRYDLLKEQMMADDPLAPLLQAVERTLSAGHRVWVVGHIVYTTSGRMPPPLPPAPYGPRGWDHDAYLTNWQYRFGTFLLKRAGRYHKVEKPIDGAFAYYEAPPLYLARGWQPPAPDETP
jgi:hypothetical protein